MSNVTNIILCTLFISDKKKIKQLNEINSWLKVKGHLPIKELQSECTGGDKNMEADIFIGAFNYLHRDEFIEFLKTLEWEWGADLFIMPENTDHFAHIFIKETSNL